jgi:hypothetical protein
MKEIAEIVSKKRNLLSDKNLIIAGPVNIYIVEMIER